MLKPTALFMPVVALAATINFDIPKAPAQNQSFKIDHVPVSSS
jgi:hypothetical protein